MEEIISVINEIVKYGLKTDIDIKNKELDLEKNLVKLYSSFFNIDFEFDERKYPEFNRKDFPKIVENVTANFPEFGYYYEVLYCYKIDEEAETALGDSIDDLTDIIYDLLQVKWRYENNSKNDSLWFFSMIFKTHSQQHILSLLNYIKNRFD